MTDLHTAKGDRLARRLDRAQGAVLILIVLVVGVMAGAASFTHVHDWTMGNSPAGTHGWFGWANAVISELIPTASLIIIARRRRVDPDAAIGYPMFLLLLAVAVSITAQLAVATPTFFGWIVSALPALAFLALSKLVFTATKARPQPVAAPTPALVAPAPSTPDIPAAPTNPPAVAATTPANSLSGGVLRATARPVPALVTPAAGSNSSTSAAEALLPGARLIAESHQQTHGEPITAGQLATRLKVSSALAKEILETLAGTAPHNGVPVSTGVAR